MTKEEIIVILDKMKENIENDLPAYKDIQQYSLYHGGWIKTSTIDIDSCKDTSCPYRVKPKTKHIIINGKSFYPESEEMNFNEKYYIPDLGSDEGVLDCTWVGMPIDFMRLELNIVYKNYDDAYEHGIAMLESIRIFEEE